MQAGQGTAAPSTLPAAAPSTELIQQYLEDNEALIQTIHDTISLGRFEAAVQYQQQLQRNLMWLAAIADAPAGAALPAQPPLASQRAEKGRATGAQLLAAADAQAAAHAASAR